ncbi:hypothetical protein QE152_g40691 [Popillia japonica]|uniref:Uncharacterized protein n=1 Tax=Popillia japonica TaxID=7064 RepID=A0AAW1HFG5_POPJA
MQTNDKQELKEAMQEFLKKYLEVDMTVRNACKLGKQTCLLELENTTDKIEVMKKKNKLRSIGNENVYINDDLSKRQREIQQIIRTKGKEEKNKGHAVKIGYGKLTVNNTEWKWDYQKGELRLVGRNQKN